MKTKMLITLSICLLLFACGEKKQPEKKVKQKTVNKTPEKPKQETKKEKILDTLPAKKDEHVHDPNCGHDHGVASSEHVSIMAKAQEERIKLAEMLPEEIREKIEKLVEERDVEGLTKMCNHLSRIGNYGNAILIASNFLLYAETKTEKEMASSFYANLVAEVFIESFNTLNDSNKSEYDNIKSLLINSLENSPNHPKMEHSDLLGFSFHRVFSLLNYDKDINTMYKIHDNYYHKINNLSKTDLDLINNMLLTSASISFQDSDNYNTIQITDKNLNKLLDFCNNIINGTKPVIIENISDIQAYKKNIENFKNYRQQLKNKTK